MILGSRIIGGILLIGFLTGMSPKPESLWSRKVMTCKNAECSTDIITWLSNQGAQTEQGKKIEKTRHFCKTPESWSPILKSMVAKDGMHNQILLKQIVSGNCFELSFSKKAVIFEVSLQGKGWHVRRAQWLYDQPERMYQGYTEN